MQNLIYSLLKNEEVIKKFKYPNVINCSDDEYGEATYIVEPRPKMVANENKNAIIPCLVSMNSLDLKHIRISLSTTNNTIL